MLKGEIVIDNLTVKYGNFTAIDGVNLVVEKGEIFGLLGPNGSGKTTIIKAMCGLLTPAIGKVSILGLDAVKDRKEIKERIGYMSQKFSLYNDLTVEENINFYSGVYGIKGAYLKRRKAEVIGLTGLQPYLHRLAKQLSGGWKQRLALACAVIHEPEIIFLDEPTAGIDPVARREIWDLFFQLSGQGVTLLVTTHYMDEAERCERLAYIYYSKQIAYGTLEELRQIPVVTPPGTTRVELICRAPSAALLYVKNFAYALESTIFGRSLHVLMKTNVSIDALISDLAKGGFDVKDHRVIEPSLEDVFVRLTKSLADEKAKERENERGKIRQ